MTHKPAAPGAQDQPSTAPEKSDVVTTFRQRDAWSRMVARDPRVKLSHRAVLHSLALCARLDNGKIIFSPTYEALAEASDCNKRTAMRALTAGEQIGIVRKIKKSDGRVSNQFELLMPEPASNGDKNACSNGDKLEVPTVTKTPPAAGSNGDSTCHGLKAERKEEVSKQEQQEGPTAPSAVQLLPIAEPREQIQLTETADAAPLSPASNSGAAEAALKIPIVENISMDARELCGSAAAGAPVASSHATFNSDKGRWNMHDDLIAGLDAVVQTPGYSELDFQRLRDAHVNRDDETGSRIAFCAVLQESHDVRSTVDALMAYARWYETWVAKHPGMKTRTLAKVIAADLWRTFRRVRENV